jgi:hypothetical protein
MEAKQEKVLARFEQVVMFPEATTSLVDPSAVAMPRQVLTPAVA